MMKKGIIFDLDGTLLDTIEDITDSMNNVLIRNNLPTHSVEDYKLFVGDGMDVLIQRVIPKEVFNNDLKNKILLEMKEEYQKNCFNKTKPFNGIPELIENLFKLNCYLAVFSNKPHHFTNICIKKYFNQNYFKIVIGAQEDIPKKPNPAGVYIIKQKLDLMSEDIFFVGDSGIDMLTAKNANIKSIGVLWGYRKKDELIKNNADYIIDNPEQIIEIIQK